MGMPGKGQHTKCANQIMVAQNMIAVSEAFIYAHKAGLDISEMIELLSGGAAGSFVLSKLGPKYVQRKFDPGFFAEYFIKDLGIVKDETKDLCMYLNQCFYESLITYCIGIPGASLSYELFKYLKSLDYENGGKSMILALEHLNNVKISEIE